MNLREKVAAYVAELRQSTDAGCRTHETLASLYRQFGRPAVNAELDAHFAAENVQREVR